MKLPITVDYLTFSVRVDELNTCSLDLSDIFTFLGLDFGDFTNIGSRMHYSKCWINNDGVSVYEPYSDRFEEMGYCVSMTGTGCRYYESFLNNGKTMGLNLVWRSFFRRLRTLTFKGYRVNVSRIDLAVDDLSEDDSYYLDLDEIERCSNNREFVSQFRNMYNLVSKNIMSGNVTGKCLYFGSIKSAVMCRFYDKLAEQRVKYKSNKEHLKKLENIKHWVRMEFVFRRNQAIKIVNAICDSGDFGDYYSKLVNGYLRFVDEDSSNITRRTSKKWWSNFLGTLERCSLSVGNYENYSFSRLVSYLKRSLSTTIFTIMSRMAPDEFFSTVYESANNRLKSKHIRIMNGQEREYMLRSYELWASLNPIHSGGGVGALRSV